MKTKLPLLAALGVAALLLALPSTAPAKEKKTDAAAPEASASPMAKAKPLTYRGKVLSLAAKTFVVGKRSFKVTDATTITKDGAPATMADIAVGEKVSGSYWKKEDGTLETRSVKIGAKAATAAKPMPDAQKKEGPATEASPKP